MRTHYSNGDEITLTSCGCDGCSPSMINGIMCHESGCPDSWRDYKKECFECGCSFYPTDRWQVECEGCILSDAEELLEELFEGDDNDSD